MPTSCPTCGKTLSSNAYYLKHIRYPCNIKCLEAHDQQDRSRKQPPPINDDVREPPPKKHQTSNSDHTPDTSGMMGISEEQVNSEFDQEEGSEGKPSAVLDGKRTNSELQEDNNVVMVDAGEEQDDIIIINTNPDVALYLQQFGEDFDHLPPEVAQRIAKARQQLAEQKQSE